MKKFIVILAMLAGTPFLLATSRVRQILPEELAAVNIEKVAEKSAAAVPKFCGSEEFSKLLNMSTSLTGRSSAIYCAIRKLPPRERENWQDFCKEFREFHQQITSKTETQIEFLRKIHPINKKLYYNKLFDIAKTEPERAVKIYDKSLLWQVDFRSLSESYHFMVDKDLKPDFEKWKVYEKIAAAEAKLSWGKDVPATETSEKTSYRSPFFDDFNKNWPAKIRFQYCFGRKLDLREFLTFAARNPAPAYLQNFGEEGSKKEELYFFDEFDDPAMITQAIGEISSRFEGAEMLEKRSRELLEAEKNYFEKSQKYSKTSREIELSRLKLLEAEFHFKEQDMFQFFLGCRDQEELARMPFFVPCVPAKNLTDDELEKLIDEAEKWRAEQAKNGVPAENNEMILQTIWISSAENIEKLYNFFYDKDVDGMLQMLEEIVEKYDGNENFWRLLERLRVAENDGIATEIWDDYQYFREQYCYYALLTASLEHLDELFVEKFGDDLPKLLDVYEQSGLPKIFGNFSEIYKNSLRNLYGEKRAERLEFIEKIRAAERSRERQN